MTNLGDRTRKQQVLQHLISQRNHWVDGPALANEEVGGSEGLRRLRELIDEGYPIESRRHPSPTRDIWQYRYVTAISSPLRRTEGKVSYTPPDKPLIEEAPKATPNAYKFEKMPRHFAFGEVAVCPRCRGKTQKYQFKKTEGKRHKDPTKEATPCLACNGWGIVPNNGPIPVTMPEGM